MDNVDRKILAELQQDGRLTVTEFADRDRLSVSPRHRRLRALESSGAISGYRAQLDPGTLGLTFEALVFVTMRAADRDTIIRHFNTSRGNADPRSCSVRYMQSNR